MRTGRGFDRLINFTDAVVAIALTLLVLPLVDIPSDFTRGDTLGRIVSEHSQQFLTFLLSFVVIWKLWRAHHHLLEYFRNYDSRVMGLHLVWLFTIVILPFTTELVASTVVQLSGSVPVYLINLLISTVALFGIELRGRSHATDLLRDDPEVAEFRGQRTVPVVPAVMLLAVVVSFLYPAGGLWCLLLLIVAGPAEDRLRRPAA